MKKIITLIALIILLISCSSFDDEPTKEIPEKFDIKIELKGEYSISMAHISVNSIVVKKWENADLPFNAEYTYDTSGDEVTNVITACNCITISVWAYLSGINEMEEFNLYVDGNLVDSTTVTDSPVDGFINPTALEFVYNF